MKSVYLFLSTVLCEGGDHIGDRNCYDDPVVIKDEHSTAPAELKEFCRQKCYDVAVNLTYTPPAYVAFDEAENCNVWCICVDKTNQTKEWVIILSGFGGLLILVKVVLYTIYKIKKRRARKAEKQRRATILSTRSRGQTNKGLTNKVFDLEEEFMSPSYVRKTLRETGIYTESSDAESVDTLDSEDLDEINRKNAALIEIYDAYRRGRGLTM